MGYQVCYASCSSMFARGSGLFSSVWSRYAAKDWYCSCKSHQYDFQKRERSVFVGFGGVALFTVPVPGVHVKGVFGSLNFAQNGVDGVL